MKKETKGKKMVRVSAIVSATGSSCVGNMAWETPYVRLCFGVGAPVEVAIWQSENAASAERYLKHGDCVKVSGFMYGDHLRNVTIVRDGDNKVFGKTKVGA